MSSLGFAKDSRIGYIKNVDTSYLTSAIYILQQVSVFCKQKSCKKTAHYHDTNRQTTQSSRHERQNVLVQNTSYYIIISAFLPQLLQ